MRRIFTFLLCLIIVLSICACGNKSPVNNTRFDTNNTESTDESIDPTKSESQTIDIENAFYYKNNNWDNGTNLDDIKSTTYLTTGDEWPALETGDLFISNGFMYGYNMKFDETKWIVDESMNGWGFRFTDKVSAESLMQYIIEININNAPVVSAAYALSGIDINKNIRSIMLPNGIVDITGLFKNSKIANSIIITCYGTIEKYNEAFDVIPDIKKKVNNITIFECSKEFQIKFTACSFDELIEIAQSAKYLNVQPLLTQNE